MNDESPPPLSRAFKLAALARMEAGENVSALARELGIRRKFLYQWRARFRAEGPAGLRPRGRPKRDLAALVPPEVPVPVDPLPAGAATKPLDLVAASKAVEAARTQIAELERKVGRQVLELDFFQRALRRVKDAPRTNDAPVAPPSTRSSER
jgi:transposase-like protein